MWFNCLVKSVLFVYCYGVLLERLYFGALVIFLGTELGSLLGFTIIFALMLT